MDCLWIQVGAAPRGQGKVVSLTILDTLLKDTGVDRFNDAKKGGPGRGSPKTVSGFGDDAVYSTAPTGSTELYVKKGIFVFMVRVTGFTAQQVQEKEKTLALDVLAKL